MKTLSIFFSLTLIFFATFGANLTANPNSVLPNGGIVIEEMVVTAFAPVDESIQEIIITDASGAIAYKSDGCYENVCNYDISSLPTGGYTATVTTDVSSFSESFQL